MHPISHVTIDEFTALTPADHSLALHHYGQQITLLENRLQLPGRADARDIMQDELSRCLTLRKLHVAALAEQLALLPTRVAAAA
ncbi:hypothetical protein J0X19_22050 [Hymenobacter sp. BT186]|uniref:Uncharacterized protein n=1 Tax=Hymenobacter telluris TaxID=2816474 RepID=A0A939EZE4_9BACT|nr:hypothetical protein [Hymenobacter telluris]MBO0360659.1 hypothetical protein [Hymenobacter telluris]MBW3376686.1 hypothetical protein [Hymenobacter norwichensis]